MEGWGSEEGGYVGQTGLKGWVWDARATTKRRLAAAMLRCLLTSDSGSEGERDDQLIEERRGKSDWRRESRWRCTQKQDDTQKLLRKSADAHTDAYYIIYTHKPYTYETETDKELW